MGIEKPIGCGEPMGQNERLISNLLYSMYKLRKPPQLPRVACVDKEIGLMFVFFKQNSQRD